MSTRTGRSAARRGDRVVLVALLDGVRAGDVSQTAAGTLRFIYDDEWRTNPASYPLSLSMPLTATEHAHDAISPFLWGLLPDSDRTLDHYGRLFGVSTRHPVALLAHIGADCAGAVQFASPETAGELQANASVARTVDWLDQDEIATELRTVREQGIPGTTRRAAGQFSLAGAQPKIALLEDKGRWGRPSGRTPTNRILKPPSGEFSGFAENEHFCLELAGHLDLGSVTSRVVRFAGELAIVVERFDRIPHNRTYRRIHQEDVCQALGVMPTRKYENEGGPGIKDIVSLLRDASLRPSDDIERFVRATALNWVIAATDAHAKNYALLHGPGGGVRLAPFYDIVSYLPYAEPALHRVKFAMKLGGNYLVRRVHRSHWEALAKANGLTARYVMENVNHVLERLPQTTENVAQSSIDEGIDESIVKRLAKRILRRTHECSAVLAHARPPTA